MARVEIDLSGDLVDEFNELKKKVEILNLEFEKLKLYLIILSFEHNIDYSEIEDAFNAKFKETFGGL